MERRSSESSQTEGDLHNYQVIHLLKKNQGIDRAPECPQKKHSASNSMCRQRDMEAASLSFTTQISHESVKHFVLNKNDLKMYSVV